jgi:hypothetical protein
MAEPDRYSCSVCGETYVVPTLAVLCEASHEQDEAA